MSRFTNEKRLIAALERRGWKKDWTNRSKYTAFTMNGSKLKMFVGPNGALRKGECASRSYSIGDAGSPTPIWKQLISDGDSLLNEVLTKEMSGGNKVDALIAKLSEVQS